MFLQLLKMCRDVFLNTVHNKSFGQLPGFKVHRIHTRPYCNHYTIGLICSTDQQTKLHMPLKVIPLQKKFFILVRDEISFLLDIENIGWQRRNFLGPRRHTCLMNHQKSNQTNQMAQRDPIDVPLTPWNPIGLPLDPLGPCRPTTWLPGTQ